MSTFRFAADCTPDSGGAVEQSRPWSGQAPRDEGAPRARGYRADLRGFLPAGARAELEACAASGRVLHTLESGPGASGTSAAAAGGAGFLFLGVLALAVFGASRR